MTAPGRLSAEASSPRANSTEPFPHRLPVDDRYKERGPLLYVFAAAAGAWVARQRSSLLRSIAARLAGRGPAMIAAECGVYKGHALIACARMARDLAVPVRIWGLDTFKGLPGISARDQELAPAGALYRDQPLFDDTSLEEAQARCDKSGVAQSIRLVPGLFRETLPMLPAQSYDFVNIDCDLYDAHLECLEYFYPRVIPGGFIFFDDYHSLEFPMARRAIDDFMVGRPERLFHLRFGGEEPNHTKAFLIRS